MDVRTHEKIVRLATLHVQLVWQRSPLVAQELVDVIHDQPFAIELAGS